MVWRLKKLIRAWSKRILLPSASISDLPPFVHRVDLEIQNITGSVEHYYHFLLGFLIPLTDWHGLGMQKRNLEIRVRSCSMMDRLTRELNIPGLVIVPKDAIPMARIIGSILWGNRCRVVELRGLDHPSCYDGQRLREAARKIRERLARDVERCRAEIFKDGKTLPVVMIERRNPDPFYASSASEIPESGARRRSIRNYSDLVNALNSSGAHVISASLEEKSLAWQIALFEGADCIIAQHGAALANLVFCPPGTTLIEIMPRDLDAGFHDKECFVNLSRVLGIHHRFVHQEGSHSSVSVEDLISIWSQTTSLSNVKKSSSLHATP
jgi:hypothetical protein